MKNLTKEIELQTIEMFRGNGYGQYSIKVEFTFEGEKFRKSFHTTDSELWDSDDKTPETLLNCIGGESVILDTI